MSTESSRQLGWQTPLLSVAIGLLLLGAGAWRSDRDLMQAQKQVEIRGQAYAAKLALTTLLSTLKDAETGQRGYLLTGKPSYLVPYMAARQQIGENFTMLEAAPLQDRFRQAGILQLQDLSARKLAILAKTIQFYQTGQTAAALAIVRSDQGKQLMDQMRAEVAALQSDIDRTLDNAPLGAASESNWIANGLMVAAACVLLGWAVFYQLQTTRRFAADADRLERFTRAFGLGLGMIRSVDGRIVAWSQGSERLYGYTAQEAEGQLSHQLLQTVFPLPLAEIEAQLRRDEHWQGELLHRHRNGSELRVLSHWALHRSRGETGGMVIEVNSDITLHAKTDTLLRTILQAAPALIYAKDLQGRMLLANPPTLALVGRPWPEIDGKTDMEFLDNAGEAAAVMENDRRLMKQGSGEFLDEQVGMDETGEPRIWSSCKAPIFDGSGTVTGLVGVSIEITANRRIEEQLRQQTIDLERARAELEDFAHIIAHDLRAPLRALKSLAEWIEEEVAPVAGPTTLSHLALMSKRADRMGVLLEALLDFSRVGHAKAKPEPVDVLALVTTIVEMLAPPSEMVVRFASENLTIQTPRAPLMHVLQNLISNAIKHHDMPAGEIVVSAWEDDGNIVFSVADDGPGIPPQAHDRIFQIFQTLGTRSSVETSGVGLSIVKKTVQGQGGQVWVESNPPARGAKFCFTWPEAGRKAVGKDEPAFTLPVV